MSKILTAPVCYLEPSDIDPSGNLKSNTTKGKPAIVMIQGNFCGYCTQAKPAFQELAKSGACTCLTIQTDGSADDKQAASMLSKVNTARGVPSFLGFNSQGKFVGMHNGGRDMASLKNFAMSLK